MAMCASPLSMDPFASANRAWASVFLFWRSSASALTAAIWASMSATLLLPDGASARGALDPRVPLLRVALEIQLGPFQPDDALEVVQPSQAVACHALEVHDPLDRREGLGGRAPRALSIIHRLHAARASRCGRSTDIWHFGFRVPSEFSFRFTNSEHEHDGAHRTILITGCSSGIGLDAAQTLKEDGWRVFASCRKEEDCQRMKSEGFDSPLIDYTKPETIERGLKEVLDATGGTLDALFNNGAHGVGGAAEDVPVGLLREIFECNFFGWHDLTCRVIKVFRNQGNHGRIIQCSSILGNVVFPMRMAYSCTKFALEAHCDALRLELKDQPGIKIVSLNVGPIRTMIRKSQCPTSTSG